MNAIKGIARILGFLCYIPVAIVNAAAAVALRISAVVIRAMIRRPITAGALILALTIGGALYGDGTISSPPACEQPATWKIVYNHENAPADGSPANAVIRVAYIAASGKVLDTEDINLTGSDLQSLIAAETVAATGENAGWNAGRKKLFRMSKWLTDNSKLTKCASCVTVG